MRRTLMLAATIAFACAASLLGQGASAQQTTLTLTPAQQVVAGYLFSTNSNPPGLTQQDITPLDNVLVAALAEDPAEIQKIITRARLDGLEQDFSPTAGGSTQVVQLQVSLYRDSTGADADVADPSLLAGLQLTPVSAPSFGDVSAAYTTNAGSLASTNIIFASGRLEVLVSEVGAPGSTKQADILPLTQIMQRYVQQNPPPAPTPAELAVLQTQTTPESILKDAYELLISNYLYKLTPSQLLTAAYNGASKALTDAGVAGVPAAPAITADDTDAGWAQFLPAYQYLEQMAPSTMSARDLAYDAASEMYNNLNCHTSFFKPSLYLREVASLKGAAQARIGILLQKFPDGTYAILRVEPNSPAEQAGLQAGDVIQAVDGQTPAQAGKNFTDLFIGAAGTPVTLTIQRPGIDQPFDLTIVRQLIQPVIEQHQILQGGIGYIELDDFTDGDVAVNDVSRALQDFQATGNVNSWILDLRYNSGGSELTLERIAGLFVPAGSLLVTETQQDGTVQTARSIGTPPDGQKSMVLLIGKDTASAAEIFAQSLKDLGRVTLVGQTTAGCVNGGLPLGLLDNSGVFVSTIEVRAGPDKVPLENVGVTPDVSVDQTLADVQQHIDPALQDAVALFTGTPLPASGSSSPAALAPSRRFIGPASPSWR